ncbi:MAG: hypothetical protein KJO55_08610, partial [Gammaproteobacteria bacterium]|nr:hypothetical protein [Gammaproteobacteria bacterium]
TLTSTVTSGLQDAQLLMVLATSALQTGQYEIALDAVREALDASNNPPGDWIETGVYSAWQAGDLNTAIGWQRQLLDRDGNNEKAWRRLAALYSENERYGMAAATLTAALQSGVIADDQTRLQLGNLLQRAGTPAIAATWVADVVTRRADDANLLQWLVQLQLDAHDDRAALESLYRYAGMRNDPATWLQVGELALTVNDERAIAALRKASADRAPGGVRGRALLLLGQALVERDNFAAARRAFTAATEYGGTTYRLAQQWLDRLPTGPVASPADNLEMQTANNVAEPVLATVDTKTVPPLRAYSARMASSPATMTADAAQLARELVRITRREKLEWTGPLTVVIDGDVSDLQQALEVEVAVPIRRVAPARGNFAASRLPPLNCAWMRYEGPWSGLETAWQELHAATLAAGHQLSGQARQVILHRAPEGRDSIVELQIGIL